MQTVAQKLTAREFFDLPGDGRSIELRRGEIVEMPDGGHLHGTVGQRLHLPIANFVVGQGLGEVPMPGTGFELDEDTVRKPDIAFVRQARCPSPPDVRWFPGAPDLAVEVISPTDVWSEVEANAQEYLDHGTAEVWLVSPFSRTVHVWRPGEKVVVHGLEDRLETALLPGFSLAVAEVFG